MRTEIENMYLRPDQVQRLESVGCRIKPVKGCENRFTLSLPNTAVIESEPQVLNGMRLMGHIRLRRPTREKINSFPFSRMTWSAAKGDIPAKLQGLSTEL